jgi:hypothetical protein
MALPPCTLHVDDSFTPIGKQYVQAVFDIFQHLDVTNGNGEVGSLSMRGGCFGGRWAGFVFTIHPAKNGIYSVQCAKKEHEMQYMFGITFSFEQDGSKIGRAFHNPHGPFLSLYGCSYECD